MTGMPTRSPTIADVDPALAEALRVWRAWLKGRDAAEQEKQLETALRALERDPDGGQRRRVLFALRDARNDRGAAAAALGVSVRTLLRWMGDLDLWEDADHQARVNGWQILPHKPRASDAEERPTKRTR